MRRRLFVVIVCVAWGSLLAQTATPERKVAGNTITSERDPAVRIEVPKSAHYVGADRWVLYTIADCELHVFVETDGRENIQRLYWLQFEQYVPSRPDLHHTYDSPKHAAIGGWDFFVDSWVRARDAPTEAGSDREHIEALVRAKGYHMPAGMMYVRLVHLLDAAKRKELMIIYGEDLTPTGFTAAELSEGGKAHDLWAGMANELLRRAEQHILVIPHP